MERMKKFFKNFDFMINFQIAIAFFISVFISNIIGLENSLTAGVVTLLSIQTTKWKTLHVALKRIVGYIIMLFLIIILFNFLGYNLLVFCLFVFIYALINSRMNISIGLAPNVVMAGHFYVEQNTSLEFILSETLIYAIALIVAITLNLLIPRIKNSSEERKNVDNFVKELILINANILDNIYVISGQKYEKFEYFNIIQMRINEIQKYIKEYQDNIIEKIENDLFDKDLYSLKYVNMRETQINALINIYNLAKLVDSDVIQSKKISKLLTNIEKDYYEYNAADELIEETNILLSEFSNAQLPKNRREFENRAILYSIMNDIKILLKTKNEFFREYIES